MTTLSNISNQELVSRLEKLVRTERKITHLVLQHVAEIEIRKIYAELGFDSMYTYLTRGLGYSEGSAYRRLQAARLVHQVPEVSEKIQEGKLHLSQLAQLQKGLKEESKKTGESFSKEQTLHILEKLENKNSFETQKTLACELNIPVISHEKISPQKDESVRLELVLSKEQFAELEHARNLLSHICPDGPWSDVIATLARQFNQKKLKGRPSRTGTIETQSATARGNTESTSRLKIKPRRSRIYLSVKVKRNLLAQAHHCCEFVDTNTGIKCGSKYQLEIDHIRPLALGGSDDIDNLRILCCTHNQLAAQKAGLRRQAKSTTC